MSQNTSIEWTDSTWNPIRGCTRVSEGCRNCYAERVAARFSGPGQPYEGLAMRGPARWTGKVALVESALTDPLRWRKPRKCFVNSMSDLFHESVPDEWIDRIFAVMALAPHITFQVLTKRPERMADYCDGLTCLRGAHRLAAAVRAAATPRSQGHSLNVIRRLLHEGGAGAVPLPNVWLGVSVEDQATADARIPLLLQTPAAVRSVSAEPLLGPVDFGAVRMTHGGRENVLRGDVSNFARRNGIDRLNSVDWLIVGGESGPGARPCDVEWVRSIVRQCRAAGVACFVKQLGARPVGDGCACSAEEGNEGAHLLECYLRLRSRNGGDPAEWPEDLRVREFPSAEVNAKAGGGR